MTWRSVQSRSLVQEKRKVINPLPRWLLTAFAHLLRERVATNQRRIFSLYCCYAVFTFASHWHIHIYMHVCVFSVSFFFFVEVRSQADLFSNNISTRPFGLLFFA